MSAPPSSKSAGEGDFPYWLVALCIIGVAIAIAIISSDIYTQVFNTVVNGLVITVFVTLVAFALAIALGLGVALLGLSDYKPLRQVSRFYIELIRGIPVLVLLFYIAFVGAPGVVYAWNF